MEWIMKTFELSFMIKSSVVIFGICGLLMCALWYPFSISFMVMGVVDVVPTLEQNIAMWTQLVFYWAVSVPCFLILAFVWKMTDSIKKDQFFSYKIAKSMKNCALLLFIDVLVFFAGNTVFFFLGWNVFAIIYYIIAVVGLAVSSIFLVASHFVYKAAQLKETEGLI